MVVAAIMFAAFRIWHRIIAIAAEGLAAANALGGKPCPFDCAMFFQGFQRVGAARWLIATRIADPWREQQAVNPHRDSNDMSGEFHDLSACVLVVCAVAA